MARISDGGGASSERIGGWGGAPVSARSARKPDTPRELGIGAGGSAASVGASEPAPPLSQPIPGAQGGAVSGALARPHAGDDGLAGIVPPAGADRSTSSLDSVGLSAQVGAAIEDFREPIRDGGRRYPVALLVALAWRTAGHRAERARWHRARAAAAQRPEVRAWHLRRARGQIHRWSRVSRCGTSAVLRTRCDACASEAVLRPVGCGVWRACPTCRGLVVAQRRARAADAMGYVERRLGRPRWSWKHLVLTLPHGAGVEADVRDLAKRLWRGYWRRVVQYVKETTGHRLVYIRSLEVTAGRTRDGHAHMHVAVYAPFLDHALLRAWWGQEIAKAGGVVVPPDSDAPRVAGRRYVPSVTREALLSGAYDSGLPVDARDMARRARLLRTRKGAQGRDLAVIPWPNVWVEGRMAPAELAKYVVKDVASWLDGEPVYDVDDLARAYVALDRTRTCSATRGLWRAVEVAAEADGEGHHGPECPACGEPGCEVRVTSLLARPPPRPWVPGPPDPRPMPLPGDEGYHHGIDLRWALGYWRALTEPVYVRPLDYQRPTLPRPDKRANGM